MSLILLSAPRISSVVTPPVVPDVPAALSASKLKATYYEAVAQFALYATSYGATQWGSCAGASNRCGYELGYLGIHTPISLHCDNSIREVTVTGRNTLVERIAVPFKQVVSAIDHTPVDPPNNGGYDETFGPTDNLPIAVLSKSMAAVHFPYAVADLIAGQYIRGERYPQTQPYTTWIDSYGTDVLNPAACECLELNWWVSINLGVGSSGLSLQPWSWRLWIWKPSTFAGPPWVLTTWDYDPSEFRIMHGVRNTACCVGKYLYFGGGNIGASGEIISSVFHCDAGHEEVDGNETTFNNGGPVPPEVACDGITPTLYIVNATPTTCQFSLTKGGAPLTLTDTSPCYLMANHRLYRMDLDPDGTGTQKPTIQLVSTKFANGRWTGNNGSLIYDPQRHGLFSLGSWLTFCDIRNDHEWSDVGTLNFPDLGFQMPMPFMCPEFDCIPFRGLKAAQALLDQPGKSFCKPDCFNRNVISLSPTRSKCGGSSQYLTSAGGKAANPGYVDNISLITFNNLGGDFKGTLGTHGVPDQDLAHPYGTVVIAAGSTFQDKDIDITSMMPELLDENTGIYLKQIATEGAFSPHVTLDPRMIITLNDIDATVLEATLSFAVDFGGSTQLYMNTAGICGFMLEALVATYGITLADIDTAILRINSNGSEVNNTTWGAFLLMPPMIVDIPHDLGSEVAGSDDPGIIVYRPLWRDADTFAADYATNGWYPYTDFYTVQRPDLVTPNGRGGIKIHLLNGEGHGASTMKRIDVDWGDYAVAAEKITIPFDAQTLLGVKFFTPMAAKDWQTGLTNVGHDGWSIQIEHGPRSPQNPGWAYVAAYIYFPGDTLGTPHIIGQDDHFLMRLGRPYTVLVEVQQNTFTSGVDNADGFIRVYFNWVPLLEMTGLSLREDESIVINTFSSAWIYHGGTEFSDRNVTYEVDDGMLCNAMPSRLHFRHERHVPS